MPIDCNHLSSLLPRSPYRHWTLELKNGRILTWCVLYRSLLFTLTLCYTMTRTLPYPVDIAEIFLGSSTCGSVLCQSAKPSAMLPCVCVQSTGALFVLLGNVMRFAGSF